MPMQEVERTDVERALEKKGISWDCPRCPRGTLVVSEDYGTIELTSSATDLEEDEAYITAMTECGNCGYIAQYVLETLLDLEESDVPGENGAEWGG